jgi:hypothetical protein
VDEVDDGLVKSLPINFIHVVPPVDAARLKPGVRLEQAQASFQDAALVNRRYFFLPRFVVLLVLPRMISFELEVNRKLRRRLIDWVIS